MHQRSLVMCLQCWFHKKIQIGLSLGFAWTRTRLPGFLCRLEEGLHDGYLASCCSITCGGQAWGPNPGASGRSTAQQRGAGRLLCLLWPPLGVPPSQCLPMSLKQGVFPHRGTPWCSSTIIGMGFVRKSG